MEIKKIKTNLPLVLKKYQFGTRYHQSNGNPVDWLHLIIHVHSKLDKVSVNDYKECNKKYSEYSEYYETSQENTKRTTICRCRNTSIRFEKYLLFLCWHFCLISSHFSSCSSWFYWPLSSLSSWSGIDDIRATQNGIIAFWCCQKEKDHS